MYACRFYFGFIFGNIDKCLFLFTAYTYICEVSFVLVCEYDVSVCVSVRVTDDAHVYVLYNRSKSSCTIKANH